MCGPLPTARSAGLIEKVAVYLFVWMAAAPGLSAAVGTAATAVAAAAAYVVFLSPEIFIPDLLLAAPLVALAANPAGAAALVGLRPAPATSARIAISAAAGCVVALGLGTALFRKFDAAFAKLPHIDELVQRLKPHLRPGDTVQTFDNAGGSIQAMHRLDVEPANRFVYELHVIGYEHPPPVVRRWQREFMDALRRRPPCAMIVCRAAFPEYLGFERLERLPELVAFIRDHYRLITAPDVEFRIYLRIEERVGE